MNGHYPYQWFRIVENLTDTSMREMISWARYIVFEEEPTHLYLARSEKISEVKKKREERKDDSEEDSDDVLDLQDVFKGHNVKPFDAQNEAAAWQLIKDVAIAAAKRFPQTLEEDAELIAQDDQKRMLTMNERNCVLFRMGEKAILRFLVTCSDTLQAMLKLTQKEAKATMVNFKHFHVCDNYIKGTVFPLLSN